MTDGAAIGILGGTFDPIHIGHLAIAEEAREALGLEQVLFVPTRMPVHKPGRRVTPAEDRVAMVTAAIAGNPSFALDRSEVDRDGPSYAVDTLEGLIAADRASDRLVEYTFILSAEAYAGLPTWHRPARLLELCRMAVVPHPGVGAAEPAEVDRQVPGALARTTLLDGPSLDVSGTLIRARVAAGRSIRYLVPDAVIAYIDDHRLYATPDPPR